MSLLDGPLSLLERRSDAISPTAHYTGEVWRVAGLSHPALGTVEGRVLHTSLRPVMTVSGLLGGETLDGFLLARHRLIDRLLTARIETGEITQVVELAAGMSPRGLRLSAAYPELTYVETDLPAMAARKREALSRAGAGHRVVELDALVDDGPESLAELAAGLDRGRGLAIITEGLLNYFPRNETDGIWARVGAALQAFPHGLYLADLHLRSDNADGRQRAFSTLLGLFVRGRVHFPYADAADARAALGEAGFAATELHPGTEGGSEPAAERVRVIEAFSG